MKTLILFGSPKQGGQTADLLSKVREYDLGEVIFVDCFREKISPCIDCGYCKTHETCFMRDGMDRVYDALKTCDRIILCSPVYFSELTSPIHGVVSRLEALYYGKRFQSLPDKKGLILLTGGGDGSAQPALASSRRYLKIMRAKENKEVCSLQTDTLPASRDKEVENAIAEIMEWYHD